VPTGPGKAEIRVVVEKLFAVDPENPDAKPVHDYSMRYYFGKKIFGRRNDLPDKKEIVFRGRSLEEGNCWVQLALITKHGNAYGGLIELKTRQGDYRLTLSDLKQVKLVTLPRPYPTFLPYFFQRTVTSAMDISDVETLQISVGPGVPESQVGLSHALAIESIRLE
jgi:hypothetical protein